MSVLTSFRSVINSKVNKPWYFSIKRPKCFPFWLQDSLLELNNIHWNNVSFIWIFRLNPVYSSLEINFFSVGPVSKTSRSILTRKIEKFVIEFLLIEGNRFCFLYMSVELVDEWRQGTFIIRVGDNLRKQNPFLEVCSVCMLETSTVTDLNVTYILELCFHIKMCWIEPFNSIESSIGTKLAIDRVSLLRASIQKLHTVRCKKRRKKSVP